MIEISEPATLTRSQRKRGSILDAGQALFLSQGYQGTSVDEIAARAQVSKQTVYKHFRDKQALLVTIVSAALERATGPVIDRITALAHTTDLRSDLVGLAADYLRAVLAEPVVQLRRLVIAEAAALPELADLYYRRAPERTLSALASSFDQLAERGILRVPEYSLAAEHFAFLIVGKSIDRALFYGGAAVLADIDPERYTQAGVEVFLAAYRVSA
jgi:TetR/AcrR family transcriptional repressor of mexJK operon